VNAAFSRRGGGTDKGRFPSLPPVSSVLCVSVCVFLLRLRCFFFFHDLQPRHRLTMKIRRKSEKTSDGVPPLHTLITCTYQKLFKKDAAFTVPVGDPAPNGGHGHGTSDQKPHRHERGSSWRVRVSHRKFPHSLTRHIMALVLLFFIIARSLVGGVISCYVLVVA
jgi:hypothetical protein